MKLNLKFKKNFFLILVLLVSLFIRNENVFAKISCYYKNDKIQMRFNINEDRSAESVTIKGKVESINEIDETEPIINWSSSEVTDFSGKDYFDKNFKCPPYLAFYARRLSTRVYAGKTQEELNKIKSSLEGCNWWTICINGGVQSWSGPVKLVEQTTPNIVEDNNGSGNSDFSATAESCATFKEKRKCENNENPKCVWSVYDEKGFCSVNGLTYLSCGDSIDIPPVVPKLTSYAVTLLKIVAPIILILVGIIELVKAIASNEDAMKKAQNKLIKKVVSAVMVFFVITIVQFIILKVADSGETGSIRACLKCFLNNDCDGSVYYKDGYGWCYYLNGNQEQCENLFDKNH